MFDRQRFNRACVAVSQRYERTAPTVETYCNWLSCARDADVTVADLHLLTQLYDNPPEPRHAANIVYKHQDRMKRDVSGQVGF